MNYSDDEIKEIKKRFLDNLWEYRVKWASTRDGKKYLTGRIVCTDEKFNSYIHNKWSKRSYKLNHISLADYISECVHLTYRALEAFDWNKGKYEWNRLFKHEDSKEVRSLFKYLIITIDHGIKDFEQWYIHRHKYHSTKKVNGKNEHFYEYVSINFTSTDELQEGNYDAPDKLVNLLNDDASIYTLHDSDDEIEFKSWNPNTKNHFMKWFLENKERVIPELWLKRYELMVRNEVTYYGDKPYGNKEREIVTGMTTGDFGNTYKFVRKYALKAYEKEFGDGLNLLESTRREQIKLIDEFFEVLNETDISDDLNRFNITSWITNKIQKSRFISDLIYDNLNSKHTYQVVTSFTGVLLPNETIYEVVTLFEKKLEQLHSFDTTVVKFHKKEHEKKQKLRVIVNENFVEYQMTEEEKEMRRKFKFFNLTTTGATVESSQDGLVMQV